jgi:hypothetical protein
LFFSFSKFLVSAREEVSGDDFIIMRWKEERKWNIS